MCLDRIDKKLKPCKTGYKVMRQIVSGRLWGLYYGSDTYPLGSWLHERDYRLGCDHARCSDIAMEDGSSYPMGWHVYHEKPSCGKSNEQVIVKVEVQEPVATGYEVDWSDIHGLSLRVTVARKIKITEVLA